jgi:tetracycline resistance efflux pump
MRERHLADGTSHLPLVATTGTTALGLQSTICNPPSTIHQPSVSSRLPARTAMPDLVFEPSFLSLLPPLLAIVLALWTRNVYGSLAAGVWLGWTILNGWNPLAGLADAVEACVQVLTNPRNARVMLFVLVIGALIATVEASGGVRGFVATLERRRLVAGPRGARVIAFIIGVVIFIESNITVLVAGSVARPLFDRHRRSREMLAYLIDTTSAAICILIPLNAWGAYVLALLDEQGVPDPLGTFVAAIPMNLYALAAVLLAGFVAVSGWAVGPMRRAEERAATGRIHAEGDVPSVEEGAFTSDAGDAVSSRALNMVLPIGAMVATMPLAMWITGGGNIRAGNGSMSVLWAVLVGLAVAWVLLLAQRRMSVDRLTRIGFRGAGAMLGVSLVLLLALALGAVARTMGAGEYVAGAVAGALPPFVLLPLVFVTGAVIAFATGTSWGTFAIMIPLAVPAALALGLPPAPFLAAALSGGIFGDHSSPISDSTVVSSLAAATDHIAHVRTQLPYAMMAAGVAVLGFALIGAAL